MNRRKFLLGVAAAAVAAPVVVEALQRAGKPTCDPTAPVDSWAACDLRLSQYGDFKMQYGDFKMVDWAELGRRHHEHLKRSMAMTSAQFQDRRCVILNESFTEVCGSSGP